MDTTAQAHSNQPPKDSKDSKDHIIATTPLPPSMQPPPPNPEPCNHPIPPPYTTDNKTSTFTWPISKCPQTTTYIAAYNRTQPPETQPPSPSACTNTHHFHQTMTIRTAVFVNEQAVPLENEFDDDDSRSTHLLLGVPKQNGYDYVGTIRIVPPSPDETHPLNGGLYVNGILQNGGSLPPPLALSGDDQDEKYLKLGRLAVRKEFRLGGKRYGRTLVIHALEHARRHADEFPGWDGLFYVHAQKQVMAFWEKCGFVLDEGLGAWVEEGIEHVGMHRRVELGKPVVD